MSINEGLCIWASLLALHASKPLGAVTAASFDTSTAAHNIEVIDNPPIIALQCTGLAAIARPAWIALAAAAVGRENARVFAAAFDFDVVFAPAQEG